MKQTVLLLCGGVSPEHEISLISAQGILSAIDRNRFSVILVGIAKTGDWHLVDEKKYYKGAFSADKISLNTDSPKVAVQPYLTADNRGRIIADGKNHDFDVVFPMLHGENGEDGTIQGFLEMIGIPFVGSGCESSAICMDKAFTKIICQDAGIPVTDFLILNSKEDTIALAKDIGDLKLPLFVKPSRTGSSVGVSKVKTPQDLIPAVEKALKYDSKVLVETGISGREIECAVLGNAEMSVALPGEIVVSKKAEFYSYEAKYILDDAAKTLAPAPLTDEQVQKAQLIASLTYQLLECRGMARVDLFLEDDTDQFFLNEINTIPGFTPISMYPKMWESSGLSYEKLITRLIELALEAKTP